MTKKTDRADINDTLKMYLLSEVQGKCPLCNGLLMTKKTNNKHVRVFDIAHIYPLNPTSIDEKLLLNEAHSTSKCNSIKSSHHLFRCKPS